MCVLEFGFLRLECSTLLGVDCLLGELENSLESLGVGNCQLSEGLAVQINVSGLQTLHEAGVSQTEGTHSGRNTSGPQTTELTLPLLAVAVLILPCFVNSILSVAEELAAETAEALGAEKDALAAGARSRPICSTCHIFVFSVL